jgi:hypothetical protein
MNITMIGRLVSMLADIIRSQIAFLLVKSARNPSGRV